MSINSKKSIPAQELKLLYEITHIIGSTLDFKEMLHEIIKLVSRLTDADACFLYVYDPTHKELVLSSSKTPHNNILGKLRLKLGEGITGWVAEHQKPVAISREAHKDPRFKFFHDLPEDLYEGFLSVPVTIKNDVVGVINVQHRKPHDYPPAQVELLCTIARQVGGAIEKARLFEEAKRKAEALQTLAAVSHTITQDKYLGDILQLIVKMTAETLESKICSVMLLDEDKAELKIVATQSMSPEYLNKPSIRVGMGVTGKAVTKKSPVSVKDVRIDPSYKYQDLAKKEGLVSMLCVPMMFKDNVIGVISAYTAEEHSFNEEETRLLQAVANQCAAAIVHTRLLSEKLAAQEALETRKIIERAKGILMKDGGLSEEQAFRAIQKQSMDKRKTMKEIAEAILLAKELQKR